MANPNTPKPMPFPGESPTVSLAMAAGQKYAPPAEEAKPARASANRHTTAKKKSAPKKSAAKKSVPRKSAAKKAA